MWLLQKEVFVCGLIGCSVFGIVFYFSNWKLWILFVLIGQCDSISMLYWFGCRLQFQVLLLWVWLLLLILLLLFRFSLFCMLVLIGVRQWQVQCSGLLLLGWVVFRQCCWNRLVVWWVLLQLNLLSSIRFGWICCSIVVILCVCLLLFFSLVISLLVLLLYSEVLQVVICRGVEDVFGMVVVLMGFWVQVLYSRVRVRIRGWVFMCIFCI